MTSLSAKIKTYYELTKPGIIYGNAIVAAAAYVFGSHGHFVLSTFLAMLLGLSLVIGGACVFNNYYDRGIDARMERTKKRGFAAGQVNPTSALIYGVVLLVVGVVLLQTINLYALGAALLGFVTYVFLYTPLKARTGLAVFVGAIAGAVPPVVGYTAATNMLDYFAVAFFAFLFLWQIPHFFAIARYRYDDYFAAGVPLLVKKPETEQARVQARKIFYASLIVLLLFCFLLLILQR
jgi:protoheme IX farnesyltransferase